MFKGVWRSALIKKKLESTIDLYHGLSNELPLGIKMTGVKSVVTIHDLIFIRYPELYKGVDRQIYLIKFKKACRSADRIIAVSEQTKSDIVEFFGTPQEKISVVYQGCAPVFQNRVVATQIPDIKKYNLPKDYLLYVGTVEERKNLLNILKAIRSMPNENLVVVGNGKSYMKLCRDYVLDNGLGSRVKFHSNVPTEDLAEFYYGAKAFIYPSTFEGFGIPILEALFCKTPVITSRGGCFSESGGPSSIYIDPHSSAEIVQAVDRLNSDEELRLKMRNNGLKHAQQFKDENVAANLMGVYNRVLK
jgi:glycosyltransferase involved in cell wall biosynthesis